MKIIRNLLLAALAFGSFSYPSNTIQAEEYCMDNGGNGYDECCRSSSLAPAIALGTIALVAIIAVAVQNTSGSNHCHSHN